MLKPFMRASSLRNIQPPKSVLLRSLRVSGAVDNLSPQEGVKGDAFVLLDAEAGTNQITVQRRLK